MERDNNNGLVPLTTGMTSSFNSKEPEDEEKTIHENKQNNHKLLCKILRNKSRRCNNLIDNNNQRHKRTSVCNNTR